MTRKLLPLLVMPLGLVVSFPAGAWAQGVPATAPAAMPANPPSAAPATGPATRPVTPAAPPPPLVIPEGFTVIEAGGRKFAVAAADEGWVREAALRSPATRPTTMPQDLLATLDGQGPDIAARLSADLVVDPKMTADWVGGSDERSLRGVLGKFVAAKAYSIFLVTSVDRLTKVMEKGWQSPYLSYNRQMRRVSPARARMLSEVEDSAFALQPVVYDPATTADADRSQWLSEQLAKFDAGVADSRMEEAARLTYLSLAYFSSDRGFKDVALAPDQVWLKAGVVGAVAAKYTSVVAGVPRRRIIAMMTREGNGMIRAAAVDLLAPTDHKQMVPKLIPAYANAVNRKSLKIVDELTLRSGDEVIPKVLKAVRERKPADGAALVAIVKEITGTDVTARLRAGQ